MESQISHRFRHDVRGALNVIRLHVELLQLQFEPSELAQIVKAIERAVTEIDMMVAAPSMGEPVDSPSVDAAAACRITMTASPFSTAGFLEH